MAVILVVDDDFSARELLKTVLRYGGHEIHEAHDGAQALILVHDLMPDLVIVDLLMPTMNGMEFVRRLRRHTDTEAIPVILYTASYLESQAQDLAHLCGVHYVINKPAEPQEIFAAVNAALGQKDAPPPKPAPIEAQEDYLSGLTAALSRKAAQVVPRLEAMIDLGLRLASERDPQVLLAQFCDATRTIIGSKMAMIAIRHKDDPQVRFQCSSGMTAELEYLIGSALCESETYRHVFSARQACRVDSLPQHIALPPGEPPVHALLCVPILSPQRTYGWLTLLESRGSGHFSDEDEVLAKILAAQVGRIYENGSLYREIKQYAQRLEEEINERKHAQEQVARANRELEYRIEQRTAELVDLNKELEAFGYSVSHELRTPLRAVIARATMTFEDEGTRLTEKGRDDLHRCIQSAQRMSCMVDDLLEFSRKGRGALKVELFDMSSLVQEVWAELIALEQRPAKLRLVSLESAPADRAMLREVWMNLLSNALKYSRASEQRTVTVSSETTENFIRYSVRDHGIGFNPAHSAKLFRVFERLDPGAAVEGTGVGLAIVERIVSKHGGRVAAESQPRRGATFSFTLPASPTSIPTEDYQTLCHSSNRV